MQEQMGTGNLIICIMLIVWVSVQLLLLWIKASFNNRPLTMAEYVFKIARVTGKSEYDVFFKSAEEWPITKEKIEEDFKAYLIDQSVPYYVMDFVRTRPKILEPAMNLRFGRILEDDVNAGRIVGRVMSK
jgi:hypothetical protein